MTCSILLILIHFPVLITAIFFPYSFEPTKSTCQNDFDMTFSNVYKAVLKIGSNGVGIDGAHLKIFPDATESFDVYSSYYFHDFGLPALLENFKSLSDS